MQKDLEASATKMKQRFDPTRETANARSTRKRDNLRSDLIRAYGLAVEFIYKKSQTDPKYKSKLRDLVSSMPQGDDQEIAMDLYGVVMKNTRQKFAPKEKGAYSGFSDKMVAAYAEGFYKEMKGVGSGKAGKILQKLLYGTDGGEMVLQRISKAYGTKEGETFMQWIDGETRIPSADKEKLRGILKSV